MSESEIHTILVCGVYIFGFISFFLLLAMPAPYGKFNRIGWGPSIDNRWGWCLMEAPAMIFFLFVYCWGAHKWEKGPLVFLCLWELHYIYRTCIFPFLLKTPKKRIPITIVISSILFNILNAYINARFISEFSNNSILFLYINVVFGIAIFIIGFSINVWSDHVLIHLRKSRDDIGYKIPFSPPFSFLHISCPNYFGELLEWTGWALACYSLSGWSFAFFTASNLIPRALISHQWYRKTFKEYPSNRKAIIPLLL